MVKRNPIERYENDRLLTVNVRRDQVVDGLWRCADDDTHGLELNKDEDGKVYLTRSSRDGYVNVYAIFGVDGVQIKTYPPKSLRGATKIKR